MNLIDGNKYIFKCNGRVCLGVYLRYQTEHEGAFYCNGKPICFESNAKNISRLYTEEDVKKLKNDLITIKEDRDDYQTRFNELTDYVDSLGL